MAEQWIRIRLGDQSLELLDGDELLARYAVSSAARGAGEQMESEQTPRGSHRIAEKIGDGAALGAVFESREPTGEICDDDAFCSEPGRDWILTRILWLDGCEQGHNRGGRVDTRERYIYIHGTPDEGSLGAPGSHGCIRMRNSDVVALFDRVEVGTRVEIDEFG